MSHTVWKSTHYYSPLAFYSWRKKNDSLITPVGCPTEKVTKVKMSSFWVSKNILINSAEQLLNTSANR